MRAALILVIFLGTLIWPGIAQQESDVPIKVNTLLVNVPVIVTDGSGRHVPGLKPEDFRIVTGGSVQKIEYFSDAEMPVSVAIVIDVSTSITKVIGGIKKAAKAFVGQLGPDDRCLVVSFSDKVRVHKRLTADKSEIKGAISNLEPVRGATGLMNEAVLEVLRMEFRNIKGRKAIVLLTDAGEIRNESTAEMLEEAIDTDTVIYPIYYPTYGFEVSRVQKTVTLGELIDKTPVGTLWKLADNTGGRLLAANGQDFVPTFQTITDELKKMYVIGFYPEESKDGMPNTISMKTVNPDLVLRTKRTIRPRAASK